MDATRSARSLPALLRLARFLAPYRLRIALAMLALVVAASSVLALGQGLKHVVDSGFTSGSLRLLNSALAGVLAIAAVLSTATYARFYKQLAPHVSGIMNEYWVQSPDNVATMRSAGMNWDDYWAGWQQLVSVTQNAGADFFGLTYGAGGDRRAIRYGRASFLLDWNGRGGAFVWSPTDTADPYNQIFVRKLGRPVSRKVERRSGVWQRTYERGVVLVNTTDSNVVVRLGRNQLTIPATDGLFARTPKR